MNKKITEFISSLDVETISNERKQTLQPLVDYIQQKISQKQATRLNFVCTHNSRRSHLGQIWAQTMAANFGINNLQCYSGGTEATALFPQVAKTLEEIGFNIQKLANQNNPLYAIKFDENALPIIGFSKTYDHAFNPKSAFAAVMTCAHADENCPFIPGVEKRISTTYEDPKAFDNTPQQAEKYHERSTQIATEMKYVFGSLEID